MQEEKKNVSTVKFLRAFGDKITDGESFNPSDDITDQRAPVNDPEMLYNQFVMPADVLSELEDETLDDFDDDIIDYEDRTDLGVDIAQYNELEHKKKVAAVLRERVKARKNLEKSNKVSSKSNQEEDSVEELEKVISDDDE